MDAARAQRLMEMFDAICDLPRAERAARLDTLRVDDAALAAELERMLQADAAPDDRLESVPDVAAAEVGWRVCPSCDTPFSADVDVCPLHGLPLEAWHGQADALLGTLLDGRYRVEAELGRGGMGIVYRARQVHVERDVAIKVLDTRARAHHELVLRFEREARIIAGLRHPNTLKLIDFGRLPGGDLFIVSPLLEGRSLGAIVLEDGPLGVERTLTMLRQVSEALAEAHEQGIVHRDLKPENVFVEVVGGQEHFIVLDFGVAKLAEATGPQTASGLTLGTPAYMSPEQVRGDRQLDGRSDLYSLGVLAYVSLTGVLPWPEGGVSQMAIHHLETPPTPIIEARPSLAAETEVTSLVMRLLEKPPDDRFADATALRAAVAQAERDRLVNGRTERETDAAAVDTYTGPPVPDDTVPELRTVGGEGSPTSRWRWALLGAAAMGAAWFGYRLWLSG